MGELSYRSGITTGDGKLAAEWRELFARHSDRFLLGSDTWINERWFAYDTIMQTYRGWLAQPGASPTSTPSGCSAARWSEQAIRLI
jgi:hypothetical protein